MRERSDARCWRERGDQEAEGRFIRPQATRSRKHDATEEGGTDLDRLEMHGSRSLTSGADG
jgi:hypothetical protein